jgi:hypothetical protein
LGGSELFVEVVLESARFSGSCETSKIIFIDGTYFSALDPRHERSRAPWRNGAGEPGAALKQIEIFLSLPSAYKPNNFRLDPVWDPIRKDPRFEKVLEQKSR